MNKKYTFLCTFMVLGLLVYTNPIQNITADVTQFSQWLITKWNNASVVTWYDDTGFQDFYSQNGSYINYTLSYYDQTNFTHPSKGILEIGNLTIQTTNNKTAENLVLSVWGWFPGLITSASDWNRQEQVAREAAQGLFTSGSLERSEHNYNLHGIQRSAVTFIYTQNTTIGNQNTTLTYDKATGVLLEGYTELKIDVLFQLELELVKSYLITEDNVTEIILLPIISGIVLFGFTKRYGRKKSR